MRPDRWIGHVELHSYGKDDGVNFQNIIEGAPVFERLIDHLHPEIHPEIRSVKDMAAGGVLLLSMGALLVAGALAASML